MSIIIVGNEAWYIKASKDILLNSGNSVVSLSDQEFLNTFQLIIKEFSLIAVEDRRSLTILVDVESIDAIEFMLKVCDILDFLLAIYHEHFLDFKKEC